MKRILVNAAQPDEIRVALVHNKKLYDLNVETTSSVQKKGNIYKGIIAQLQPSLDAVFIDYGSGKQGFLPFKEIVSECFLEVPEGEEPSVKNSLKVGQSLLVQVAKEERGRKGAALTTHISLAGPHLVLVPYKNHEQSISKKISGKDRGLLKNILNHIKVPEDIGIIARTSSVGCSISELQWSLNYLLHLWSVIQKISEKTDKPVLIHKEDSLIACTIRDYMREDIEEVIIDNADTFEEGKQFIELALPKFKDKIKFYEDQTPLFTRFQIEQQSASIYEREVPLPSGGSISIDLTEALVAIDINSAKAIQGSDVEDTALRINLEACEEIARQARLRDLAGLIVVDFIDMKSPEHNNEVENTLTKHLKGDRAQIQIGEVLPKFGLLTFSRQRLKLSILEKTNEPCPHCTGIGYIRSTESTGVSILREIQEHFHQQKFATVVVKTSLDCATFLLNNKKHQIQQVEEKYNIRIIVIPLQNMSKPQFDLTFYDAKKQIKFSKQNLKIANDFQKYTQTEPNKKQEEPLTKTIKPKVPPPKTGFFEKIKLFFMSKNAHKNQKKTDKKR